MTSTGEEKTPTYEVLEGLYNIIPLVTPTEENFMPRMLEEVEMMIAHLSAFTQTAATNVDNNIIAIGTKLHAIKGEVESYLVVEETQERSLL